jgi:uncharacterized membrane protein
MREMTMNLSILNLSRTIKHLLLPQWLVKRDFPAATLAAIEQAVAASERQHSGELRFVVEGGLPWNELWQGYSPHQRAIELFSQLQVWDTENNSGILIYVQWVDHAVEILADRGIAARVPQAEWDAICREMEAAFKRGDYRSGALAAIDRVSHLLQLHFPAAADNRNELSNKPLLL